MRQDNKHYWYGNKKVDIEVISASAMAGRKIELIKYLRMVSSLGLKGAREEIDKALSPTYTVADQIKRVHQVFEHYSDFTEPKLTKQQFMDLISEAIDKGLAFRMDPLESVLTLCNNIKRDGGLSTVAAEYERLIDRI